RKELTIFQENSSLEKFQAAKKIVAQQRKEEHEKQRKAQKNNVQMSNYWNRSPWERRPATLALIGVSILVTLLFLSYHQNIKSIEQYNNLDTPTNILNSLFFLDPMYPLVTPEVAAASGRPKSWYRDDSTIDRLSSIADGEFWRLITPIFLHFTPIHLVFNMILFYQLGGQVEERHNSWIFLFIVLILGVSTVLCASLAPGSWDKVLNMGGSVRSGGMSGVVYGLLGYIWMRVAYSPKRGFTLSPTLILMAMAWLAICSSGMFSTLDNVSNIAHASGLAFGMLLGYATAKQSELS
ncbi:MAG: rhomboid family intramembrane serine protease, partial [Pirellulaceae bacterium]|nr:rhomboid family intramembrane serine protease [Pirellulaceae bacterium]